MLFGIIPESLIAKKNETELVIYFKNGSVYQLKGSDQPDALRGPNPMGVVFDEFDTQKQEGWGVVEPVLRANGGWAWFVGTPRGKQKLYDFYNRGQEGHKEWGSWLLKASTSGIIEEEQLREARKGMTEAHFNQEFECDFLEGEGSVFRGVRDIMISKPQAPIKDRLYLMGVDLAKVQDWTVVRVYDRETNQLVFSDRWQTLDWVYQKRKIAAYAKHYNNAMAIIDSTGVGDPICDDLTHMGIGVVPFKISHISKKDIIEKLSIWIQQRKFTIFKQEQTMLEYDNFSYTQDRMGKVFYGARTGYHDDTVIADALAVWYLTPVYIPEFTIESTPTQIAFARSKMRYEQSENEKEYGEDFREWDEWSSEGMDAGGYG